MRSIVWFRGRDLRLADHAPLTLAIADGEVIPLFVLDPYFFAPERGLMLPHRMQFLLESLRELATRVAELGSQLLLVSGRSVEVVPMLAGLWRADRILAYRWSEPFGRERDSRVAAALEGSGCRLELAEGETLAPPGSVRTGDGMYRIFTPFWRAFQRDVVVGPALPAPGSLPALPVGVALPDFLAAPLPELSIFGPHNPRLPAGGERAGQQRLQRFLGHLADYPAARDELASAATSRLSADLHFGTLSVRSAWNAATARAERRGELGAAAGTFCRQLIWREFAHHHLWQDPELLVRPFQPAFEDFPWREDAPSLAGWCEGRTGYPVVDAAARQLQAEGYVHNRARMIAASFLCKHLLLPWRSGYDHYMRWLVDGNWANNCLGWQWSAGCGCDAQPWFRVFNPMLQGEKHDSLGRYVRRWLPELAALPDRFIHRPWEAPAAVLREAGLRIGTHYPAPIIDHQRGRERFLTTAKAHLKRSDERKLAVRFDGDSDKEI